jgi:tetratricopeptide (TPR) repeat protein
MSRTGLLVLACLGLVGCGRASPEALDYLDHQRSLQTLADQAVAEGRLGDAHTALGTAARLRAPTGMDPAEVAALQRDACLRLANLDLQRGQAEQALRSAQRGLDLAPSRDLFTAGLLVARGKAEEALDRDSEAIADYHAAQIIDEALLAAEAADGGEP